MIRIRRTLGIIVLLTFVLIKIKCVERTSVCPIGFEELRRIDSPYIISHCYRLKGPEKFDDKNENCIKNKYSIDFVRKYNLTKPGQLFWTNYKTLYSGGVFVDTETGDVISKKAKTELDVDRDYCAVWNSETDELISASCNDKFYRYCVVDALATRTQIDHKAIFSSPRSTTLFVIDGVRATWSQAQMLCNARNATLLQKGWRYANVYKYWLKNNTTPLGIFMSINDKLLWSQPEDDVAEVPDTEWSFQDESFSVATSLVALTEGTWHLVNNSSIFYNIICERAIYPVVYKSLLTYPTISVVNDDAFREFNFKIGADCFSDSSIIMEEVFTRPHVQTTRVDIIPTNSTSAQLRMENDGYYWCKDYMVPFDDFPPGAIILGDKYLYVKDVDFIRNLYALKIKFMKQYTYEKLDLFMKIWMKKLSEYLFLYNEYLSRYSHLDVSSTYRIQDVLKAFNNTEKLEQFSENIVYKYCKLKRIYLDRKTALIHIDLLENIRPLVPSYWENIEVVFMRPTYHCKIPSDSHRSLILGESIEYDQCLNYKCVGDYNEGVQLVETKAEDCRRDNWRESYSTQSWRIDVEDEEAVTTVTYDTSTEEDYDSYSNEYTSTETLTTDLTTDFTLWDTVSTDTLPPITTITSESPITVTTVATPPPRPPQQQVDDVLYHLENLLNTSEPIPVTEIGNAFDEVDDLLSLVEEVEIPGNFLTMLDQMGARADLNGSNRLATVRRHVALIITTTEPNNPIRGLRLATRIDEAFKEEAFHLLADRDNETHLEIDSSEAVVYLPESIAISEKRISFVVFRDDRPFLPAPGYHHYSVNSRVLSINVENLTEFDEGEVIEIYLRPTEETIERNQSRSCGYWNFMENGTGIWSQEGCVFVPSREGLLDICRCTHLTHFAEVLVPRHVFSESHESALEYLSIIGCFISLLGLGMIGMTATLFRSWRRDFNNKIWLNLCLAIFLLIISFLIVAFADFGHYNLPCMFTGVMLHYSVICSFCWMLVAAIISYRRLVLVFTRDASHKLLRASAFAYGTPFAIFGILLSIDPLAYAGRFEETMPSGAFCYPSGLALWLAVYVPVAMMLLANCTLFALIVRSVFATKQIQRHGDANEAIRCASVSCLLVFLFGLPWIFGLFANVLVFAYLFTLTATFQGFVLFLFFVIGNKKTRELWMNKLKIKQSRKVPVSSSTGYRGANTVTIEATSSKPRSLAGTDDSRFS